VRDLICPRGLLGILYFDDKRFYARDYLDVLYAHKADKYAVHILASHNSARRLIVLLRAADSVTMYTTFWGPLYADDEAMQSLDLCISPRTLPI
jgi:hypothetical protein